MTSQKTNIYAIDAIRTISILAVIMIHTTSRTLEFFHYDLNSLPFTFFLNQITRFAVPLFFLISGFVLELNFHLNETYWHYFQKRVNKIFIPYIFWSAVYYFLIYGSHPDSYLKALLTGSASYQLYFIPSLIIFYLLFPLLHKLIKYISSKWVLILLGILELYILDRDYRVSHFAVNFPVAVALFNYYVFFLGMIAAKNYEKLLLFASRYKYHITGALFFLMAYLFWQGKTLYYKTYNIGAFYSQWRPSILIYTILIGLIAFYFFENKHLGERFFNKLSKLSFFVFFAHVFILEKIWQFVGSSWKGWFDLPFFILVSGFTFFIALLAHKIKYLNRLTG